MQEQLQKVEHKRGEDLTLLENERGMQRHERAPCAAIAEMVQTSLFIRCLLLKNTQKKGLKGGVMPKSHLVIGKRP
jgi:hypothetical protein